MSEVACILVNYRNPDDTLACLDSLLKAGLESFKIFLVNNFTADGSGEMFSRYIRESGMDAAYMDAGGNIGFAAGVNMGVRAALDEKIPNIMLLNNDAVVAEAFTRESLKALRTYPGEVLAGRVDDFTSGDATFNIGTISPLTGQIRHIFDPNFKGEVNFVSGCLMLVPSEVFGKVGLFDEKLFMYYEDADFCFRLKKGGIRVRYCPSIVIRHKFSASVTRAKTPKEYYRIRNQTYTVMHSANVVQRGLYLCFLMLMPFYKLIRMPQVFGQAIKGALDGLAGKMGKRHSDG